MPQAHGRSGVAMPGGYDTAMSFTVLAHPWSVADECSGYIRTPAIHGGCMPYVHGYETNQ